MSVETRPDQLGPPDPAPELVREMALDTALRRLVDDLFTHQAIAERLGSIAADPEVEALVNTWKQQLTDELAETAYRSVENVAGVIDLLHSAGATLSLAPQERQEWERKAGWHKPFPVAAICREDLRSLLHDETIATLTDEHLRQIADRLGDAWRNGGNYEDSLAQTTWLVVGKLDLTELDPPADEPSLDEANIPDNRTPSPDKPA